MALIPGTTTGNDTLTGTEFADSIIGDAGNDSLSGLAGADSITGDAGNDTITGGAGDDTLEGGEGNDSFVQSGVFGIDSINGGAGADTVVFSGSATSSVIRLAAIASVETINMSNTTLFGTIAEDAFDFSGVTTISNRGLVDLAAGFDSFIGSQAGDSVNGGADDDTLDGGAGNDTLIGGSGSDSVIGGTGDDRLVSTGLEFSTVFTGGAGTDTLALVSSSEGVTSISDLQLDALASIEIIAFETGGGLSGTAGSNRFDLSGVTTLTNAGAIDLRAGNDRYAGSLAAESVLGGDGNDTLGGGAGNDTLDGGSGTDSLSGGDGDDRLVSTGLESTTKFLGGAGADSLALVGSSTGVTSISTLKLDAAASIETLRFETGGGLAGTKFSDIFDLSGVATVVGTGVIDMRDGGDRFIGTQAGDSVLGGKGRDNLNGGLGADSLLGGDDGDTLTGGVGNDTLDGGAGADSLVGGDGDDLLRSGGAETSATFSGGAGTDTLAFIKEGGLDTTITNLKLGAAASIERVDYTVGSLSGSASRNVFDLSGVTTIVSNKLVSLFAGSDVFTGSQVADMVDGGAGNDILNGGLGADTLTGGAGNDTFIVDNVGDVVSEAVGGGTDQVKSSVTYALSADVEKLFLTGTAAINATGNALGNTLGGNAAANTLDGGAGKDTMSGGAGDDAYIVDDAKDVVTEKSTGGVDTVRASATYTLGAYAENLELTGSAAINGTGNTQDNVLTGNAGANILNGDSGADSMSGGAGDDTYVVDNLGDAVTEGSNNGVDTVRSSVSYSLTGNVENLSLTSSKALQGAGNGLSNVITAVSGNNVLDGRAGSDTMSGGIGNDTYVVDNTGDVVVELVKQGTDTVQSSVTYTLSAAVEKLTLTGSGAISGTGNELINEIAGNDGANVIDGRLGSDKLTGGAGADVFVFSTTLGARNIDTITDFAVVDDTIHLDDAVFAGLTPGALAAGALVIATAAADADDRIIYNSSSGALLFDADGSGSGKAVKFATISPGLQLTEADFVIV